MSIVIANWKMNKTKQEAIEYINTLSEWLPKNLKIQVKIAPSFTLLDTVSKEANHSCLEIGAQNISSHRKGSYTGEVSGFMLKEAGAHFVLLGHSERRTLFCESNAMIHEKLKRALEEGLKPVLCIGETLQDRQEGKMREKLQAQLNEVIRGIPIEDLKELMIAYEPVWAIGTGEMATIEIIKQVKEECFSLLKEAGGENFATTIPFLYGGSVKPHGITPLLSEAGIEGVLIGNASLNVETFYQCIENASKVNL